MKTKMLIPENLSQAQLIVTSGRLEVSSKGLDSPSVVRIEPRSFRNWLEFANFAETTLCAKCIFADDGKRIAILGKYSQFGQIIFHDSTGTLFTDSDFITAYLGGIGGKIQVEGTEFSLWNPNDNRSVVLYSKSAENCIGSDCVEGESWVTHTNFLIGSYHSVGSITRQLSGGTSTASYECCTNGQLVNVDGQKKCRTLKPGAWEYDQELGILVPTTGDPYNFSEPSICAAQVLDNVLGVTATLIFGPDNSLVLSASKSNTSEVKVGQWLLTVGMFDTGPDFVDDVVGICGFHTSTRGGSVTTSDGFTEGTC